MTIQLVAHHTLEELEIAYRESERAVERSRWQIIWLKKKGKTAAQISEVTGYHTGTIQRIVSRYNQSSQDGIVDARRFNKSELALNKDQQEELLRILKTERDDHGLWTSAKVQCYVKEHFGIEITTPCAWGYLKRLGLSVQLPRPTHVKSATPDEQDIFKKKVEWALRIGRLAYPEKEVRLYVEDEGRFGLKPILRRGWALQGERPIIAQKRGYQWFYTYIFVEPNTGESQFVILPTVSIDMMQLALEEFSKSIDPLGHKIIILLLDQAGWHMSKTLKIPQNLLLIPFPPYTPELSPAEPMVERLKLPIANKTFETLDEVIDIVKSECERLMANVLEVRSLTLFPWIKNAIQSI
jgi:transposase